MKIVTNQACEQAYQVNVLGFPQNLVERSSILRTTCHESLGMIWLVYYFSTFPHFLGLHVVLVGSAFLVQVEKHKAMIFTFLSSCRKVTVGI